MKKVAVDPLGGQDADDVRVVERGQQAWLLQQLVERPPVWRCGTLIATFLSIQESRARKTVPKPPEPRFARI